MTITKNLRQFMVKMADVPEWLFGPEPPPWPYQGPSNEYSLLGLRAPDTPEELRAINRHNKQVDIIDLLESPQGRSGDSTTARLIQMGRNIDRETLELLKIYQAVGTPEAKQNWYDAMERGRSIRLAADTHLGRQVLNDLVYEMNTVPRDSAKYKQLYNDYRATAARIDFYPEVSDIGIPGERYPYSLEGDFPEAKKPTNKFDPKTDLAVEGQKPSTKLRGMVRGAGAAAAIAALPETLPAAWKGMKGIWKSRPEWMGGQGAGDLMQPYGQGWQSKGQFSDGTAAAYGDLGIDLALQGGNIAKGLGDFVADFVPWRAGGGGLFGTGYDPSIPIRHGANIVVGPSLRQFGGVDTSSLEGAIGAPEGGQHHLLGDWQVPTDPDTAPAIRKAITSLAPLAEAQRKQQFDAVNAGGSGGASRWR